MFGGLQRLGDFRRQSQHLLGNVGGRGRTRIQRIRHRETKSRLVVGGSAICTRGDIIQTRCAGAGDEQGSIFILHRLAHGMVHSNT